VTGETTRIGVAIDIPEPWGAQLTQRRADAGDPQAAYTPAHVTLLGPTEVAGDALPAIERHLEKVAAAQQPFTIHLRGTGTFRPVTEVVFVTLAVGISECELLAEAITSADDIDRDARFPYHPHVTVAHDLPYDVLQRAFDEMASYDVRFEVWGFSLYEHGADAVWRPQRDFPLGQELPGPRSE